MRNEVEAVAAHRKPEAESIPAKCVGDVEALLAEERQRANIEIFGLHKQIAEFVNQTRVDREQLEKLRQRAAVAATRTAQLDEELADQRDQTRALAALRRWEATLVERRLALREKESHALEALMEYRLQKGVRSLARLQDSTSYRFARALSDALRSSRELLRLPKTLTQLAAHRWSARRSAQLRSRSDALDERLQNLLAAYVGGGLPAFLAGLLQLDADAALEASAFERLAVHLGSTSPSLAAIAFVQAYKADPTPARGSVAAFGAFDCGELERAAALIGDDVIRAHLDESSERKARTIQQLAQWSRQLPTAPAGAPQSRKAGQGSILYVGTPSSRPAAIYQTREWLSLLHREGLSIAALAPPRTLRYRAGKELVDPVDQSNALRFAALRRSARTESLAEYVEHAVSLIADAAQEHGASIIYCPSDPDVAIPALKAARLATASFVYDIRTVGEGNLLYNPPSACDSELTRLQSTLAQHIARNADYVYAGSESLRTVLIEHGASPERVVAFPNCVSTAGLPKVQTSLSERFVVAFPRPLTRREGFDLLLEAVAKLAAGGIDVEVLVGDEELPPDMATLATRLGIADRISTFGRKPWVDSMRRLSTAHVVVFPQRPDGLADLATPVELTHVMAIGLTVAASNLPGFAREIEDGVNGSLFPAENASALANLLEEWARDRSLTTRFGMAARSRIQSLRNHETYAPDAIEFLRTRIPPSPRIRNRSERPGSRFGGSRTTFGVRHADQTLPDALVARLEKPFPYDSVCHQLAKAPNEPERSIVGVLKPLDAVLKRMHRPLRVDQGLFADGVETRAFVFDSTVADEFWGWEGCLSHRNNHANLALIKLLRTAQSRKVRTILLFDERSAMRPFFADFVEEFDFAINVVESNLVEQILTLTNSQRSGG